MHHIGLENLTELFRAGGEHLRALLAEKTDPLGRLNDFDHIRMNFVDDCPGSSRRCQKAPPGTDIELGVPHLSDRSHVGHTAVALGAGYANGPQLAALDELQG